MANWDWWQQQYAPDMVAAELAFRAELEQADESKDRHYYDGVPAEPPVIDAKERTQTSVTIQPRADKENGNGTVH